MSRTRALDRVRLTVACGALAAIAGCAVPAPADRPAAILAMEPQSLRAADGAILPMRSWLPQVTPRAVILALHGFGDYSAAFRQPATFWASHGVATFAYDQRGFGGSPDTHYWAGADAMEADAKAVMAILRRRYPGVPVFLLGESMGGSVALAASTDADSPDADGVILVSPAVWAHDVMGTIERSALWVTKLIAPGLWLEAPRGLAIHPSDNIDMLRAMARDSLVQLGARADTTAGLMALMDRAGDSGGRIRRPTLVLFGAHEEILPRQAVAAFLDGLPAQNVRVALYPDGYHMLLRDLSAPIVWRDILAWIADHSQKLPSGDECRGEAAQSAPCRAAAG